MIPLADRLQELQDGFVQRTEARRAAVQADLDGMEKLLAGRCRVPPYLRRLFGTWHYDEDGNMVFEEPEK